MSKAEQLIVRLSSYLEDPQRGGYSFYESWIADAEEENPGMSVALREAAIGLVNNSEGAVLRSAIQALACLGTSNDAGSLHFLAEHADKRISFEASCAIAHIEFRHALLETLLESVQDRDSFVRFAEALAKERERAAKLERDEPSRYCLDGALGWKNADISSFLYAGLSRLEMTPGSEKVAWKVFADFLYHGKVVE